MEYHLQVSVISKRFELQQRDCAQMKDLSKQIKELIKFFELSYGGKKVAEDFCARWYDGSQIQ